MAWIRSNKKSSKSTAESYIYNVGHCAFNSGYIHSANTKIKFKAELESWKSSAEWQGVFGACNGNFRANSLMFWSTTNSTKVGYSRTNNYIVGDEVTASESSTSANWPYTSCIFTAEGQTVSWYREEDVPTIRSLISTGTVDSGICSLAIFNINTATSSSEWVVSNGVTSYMKLYWFEIYENDILVHRFIPAYNNNQYCLYDEIDNTYIYDTQANGVNMRGFIAS